MASTYVTAEPDWFSLPTKKTFRLVGLGRIRSDWVGLRPDQDRIDGSFGPAVREIHATAGWKPGRESGRALKHFIVHVIILSHFPTSQNPPVGFQARFFLARSEPCKLLSSNGLKGKKSQKNEKTQK
jgi:hypothetical protein